MQTVTIIAAVADNLCIGANNRLPWHIPEDFAFFKAYTLHKTVIMGRKTWDSLPRKPLPERRNVVISRRPGFAPPGAEVCASLEEALRRYADEPEAVIIGGAQIYAAALPRATDLRLTEVHVSPRGDAFFPAFDRALWQEVGRESRISPAGLRFDFVHRRRRSDNGDAVRG